MIPPEFEYSRPASVSEVLALIGTRPSDCRVIAGGQSLLPLLKSRLVQPNLIVDLWRIATLSYLRIDGGAIDIGAMTTYRTIELSQEAATHCPVLPETMRGIADPHVRNLGTIGGSLCQADPRGDLPACALALDATLTASSTKGTRTIPIAEFFTGPFSTCLRNDELLTSIRIPVKPSCTGAYLKLARRAGAFADVGVAASIEWEGDDVCRNSRLALCNAGPTPILVDGVTGILAGARLDERKIDEVAQLAQTAAEPMADPVVSVDYRKAMIKTMVGRALRLTRERARRRA
jgi:aerobic carbon-monoxide dehydrogenase medium subunit